MQREVISVPVDADQEDIAQTMARYDFLALPVVDAENRIVGIVTHDDVIDVVVQEATEDALRMGGVGTMVEHYLEAPFLTLWRKRSGWLACLFVAEMFTFSALAHFQTAIEKIIALSLFVPLCISTGGNSGFSGGNADYAGDGAATNSTLRLAPRDSARTHHGIGTRADPRSDRLFEGSRDADDLVGAGGERAFDAGLRHRPSGRGHLPVGDAGRFDFAPRFFATWL